METLKSGIYSFKSKASGYRYIGQSVNLENRRKEHMRSLARGDHHSRHLQRSYIANGIDSVEYEVLEYCGRGCLTFREQYWLDRYRESGLFNSAPAADSNFGVKWSDEAKAQRSASQIGRRSSVEARQKLSEALKGRVFSKEHAEKLRLARIGKTHSEEAKAKMSAARKGVKFSPERIANMVLWQAGRKHTEESKAKMRAFRLGKTASEETKAKIGAAQVGKPRLPESNLKMIETRKRNKLLKSQDSA
jgi:group I intron endonuclease